MFTIKVKGLKELNKKLDKIIKDIPDTTSKAIMEAMRKTADYIIVQSPSMSGNLKESIKYEILDSNSKAVLGRVYADANVAPYALWVNYGTGIYAEGEGGSRAEKIPWFVHTSMADLSGYGYQIWTAPSGDQFYIVYGQHATHFFDSAGFIMRDDNVKEVAQAISGLIRRNGHAT